MLPIHAAKFFQSQQELVAFWIRILFCIVHFSFFVAFVTAEYLLRQIGATICACLGISVACLRDGAVSVLVRVQTTAIATAAIAVSVATNVSDRIGGTVTQRL